MPVKKYDLSLLKEQCGNDKNFFNEMIDVFIKSTLEGVERLEEAEKNNDQKQLAHYAHKIISPCRHIEARNLIDLLKEVESKADASELSKERAAWLVSEIRKEAGALIEDLKKEHLN